MAVIAHPPRPATGRGSMSQSTTRASGNVTTMNTSATAT